MLVLTGCTPSAAAEGKARLFRKEADVAQRSASFLRKELQESVDRNLDLDGERDAAAKARDEAVGKSPVFCQVSWYLLRVS